MKKPNITEGEWNYFRQNIGSNGEILVTNVFAKESDLQAISAVPEMIDALIEARQYIQTKYNIFKEQYPEDEPHNCVQKLEAINKALRKAGCEL